MMISPVVFKDARKTMGLTQSALAEKLGVSLRTIQYIESGDRQCELTTELAFRWIAHSDYAFQLPYESQEEFNV